MLEKRFPGTLDSLVYIRDFVSAAARIAGLDSQKTYDLCLAVDEVATNIVTHGYEEAGLEGDIGLEARQERGELIIRMSDRGRTYDPDGVPQPDVQNPLNQEDPGGWGLLLAKTGVDEFDYATTDSGNLHIFVMRLPKRVT